MWQDHVNSAFLASGAMLNFLNVRRVWKDKSVRGVSLWPTVLFASWSVWDVYYFPHLDQWFSMAGSVMAGASNFSWLALAIKYRKS